MPKIYHSGDFPAIVDAKRERKLFTRIRDYLRPEAFEQRERDRQRAQWVETLETCQRMRQWCDGSEMVARDQLERLNREDLAHTPTPWTPAVRVPDRITIDGNREYVRVPRTAREAFGHSVEFNEPPELPFWTTLLQILSGGLLIAGLIFTGFVIVWKHLP